MARGRKTVRKTPALAELQSCLTEAGEQFPEDDEKFRMWLRRRCEKELWFMARWVLNNDKLSLGRFHRDEVCTFLTDFSKNRFKLLMLPMGHLKTTIASRCLPLHVLIQPQRGNVYFPGKRGGDCRILLANENEVKSKENLSYISQHMESNDLLYWLWPDVFYERRKDANLWTDTQITVKRSNPFAEASLTIVGVKTGFVGRYFDIIIGDDIAALEASQNPPLMERAKKWRKAAATRFYDKKRGIFIGVGTHWPSSEDVYTEWEKDARVEVMVRSVFETRDVPGGPPVETPLWPEEFSMEIIEEIRKGTDAQDWACWYMNKPASQGYTALRWDEVREYRMEIIDGRQILVFAETIEDERIATRFKTKARNLGFILGSYTPENAHARTRRPTGMDENYYDYMREKYPDRIPKPDAGS